MKEKYGRFAMVALVALLVLGLSACGGSEEEPAPPPGHPAATGAEKGVIPPTGPSVVEVPDAIKGKWKAVVLTVEDRSLGTNNDYTVNLGDTLDIPDSDLSVKVKEFFPAFMMNGSTITSASNNPENPAAKVEVKEGGAVIFDSWLFAKFPTTHPFPHQRFGIILKEGIPS